MNAKALTTAVITFVIAVVLFSSVLVPIIGDASSTTISVENEGASWMRYDMKNSIVGTDISVTEDSGNITITNGTDSQSNELSDALIIYAGNNGSVYYDGTNMIVLSKNNDATTYGTLTGSFTVREINGSVIASDGTNTYDLGTPTWAYVPSSVGQYAMFNDTGFKTEDEPLASISQTYAGVSAYNDIINMDIDLTQNVTMDGENVDSVTWIKHIEPSPELTPIDPERIKIDPLDPSLIDPIDIGGDSATIKAVPTPTYTDGDWGYDLIASGDNVGKAVIVSYSGSGGNLTIPDTVGGYTVAELGKGTNSATIFDNNSISDTTIIIPSTVKKINSYAFYAITKLKGDLVIPSNVENIGFSAFSNTGITSLSLTDGLKIIDTNAFYGCSDLITDLTIPNTVTTLYDGAFSQCGGVNNIILPTGITVVQSKLFQLTPITGDIIIPSGVRTISNMAFQQCGNNVDVIVIPDSVTTISQEAFAVTQYKGIVTMVNSGADIHNYAFFTGGRTYGEVLNLGSLELTTTSYGMKAESVQDHLDAIGFIAPAYFEEVVKNEGAVWDILTVIPLFIAILLIVGTVTLIAWRR